MLTKWKVGLLNFYYISNLLPNGAYVRVFGFLRDFEFVPSIFFVFFILFLHFSRFVYLQEIEVLDSIIPCNLCHDRNIAKKTKILCDQYNKFTLKFFRSSLLMLFVYKSLKEIKFCIKWDTCITTSITIFTTIISGILSTWHFFSALSELS